TRVRKYIPKRVLFLCDGAQGAGHYPIKMQGAGIDLLCLAGHKGLMGIQGSGALLFSDRAAPTPLLHGGTGSMSFSLDMPDFYPDALEAGTVSYPAILSLLRGVEKLQAEEKEIFDKIQGLTKYCLEGLQTLHNYTLYSSINPCGIVAFAHKALPSQTIADLLNEEFFIAVRGGFHCAPLMHEALQTQENGLVRVSFSHYTSHYEIDLLLDALRSIDEKNTP
ncbi:MAG: aminotransferase class V-fold PLP-dependent enzyme, partial [Clostridia bacterium]|nr:aminotransferase class V-fold PLP-dependent enzyme [Clostridia bacterium]